MNKIIGLKFLIYKILHVLLKNMINSKSKYNVIRKKIFERKYIKLKSKSNFEAHF